ncbi:MAG: class I SAM-dependent methyltransferase [Anaerolineae bacterium]|nr:class I SAM-dependent methyltransferase [Anaerolineae bacterium]MCI0610537.1 class I SAM-dependent methyltransferase [Anaerolineae bacterium]
MKNSGQDIWSQWLLNRRFGGDPERLSYMLDFLYPVRDKVLSRINLDDGGTLLDIGSGDGLIAFGALEEFETCRVIFSDISDDLLNHAHALARNMKLQHRCEFVRASADDLSMFEDESVNAVTTRSVLIYVSAKQQSFKEFQRVLKPGGQLSIFEPINRFAYPEPEDRFAGYPIMPIVELAQKLKAVYRRIQPPDTDPMTDFDERDLMIYAEKAGFSTINVELQIEVKPPENTDWGTFLHAAGNPKIPSIEEAMQQAFTLGETETFTSYLRPLVESRQGIHRSAVAYLWAVK